MGSVSPMEDTVYARTTSLGLPYSAVDHTISRALFSCRGPASSFTTASSESARRPSVHALVDKQYHGRQSEH